MTQLIDSHCHLDRIDLEPFAGSMEALLQSIREHGVSRMLCVSITMEDFPGVLELAHRYENVYATVGVHPNERKGHEPTVEELVRHASDPRVLGIGETGLDYFRSEGAAQWQHERFRRHIAAAKQAGKPLIVHSREARQDTIAILREEGADAVGGIMHCFVEDWETARQAMDLGFYISFSGIVTFKTATDLKQVAARVPADRLLVETDSPYLAPVPFRGKPNQPGYVRYIAEHLAELRGTSVDEIATQTTDNFCRLFRL